MVSPHATDQSKPRRLSGLMGSRKPSMKPPPQFKLTHGFDMRVIKGEVRTMAKEVLGVSGRTKNAASWTLLVQRSLPGVGSGRAVPERKDAAAAHFVCKTSARPRQSVADAQHRTLAALSGSLRVLPQPGWAYALPPPRPPIFSPSPCMTERASRDDTTRTGDALPYLRRPQRRRSRGLAEELRVYDPTSHPGGQARGACTKVGSQQEAAHAEMRVLLRAAGSTAYSGAARGGAARTLRRQLTVGNRRGGLPHGTTGSCIECRPAQPYAASAWCVAEDLQVPYAAVKAV
eukprot:295073-Chlamydomonas_euryale.AAC.2